jgi:hypothetical protein
MEVAHAAHALTIEELTASIAHEVSDPSRRPHFVERGNLRGDLVRNKLA